MEVVLRSLLGITEHTSVPDFAELEKAMLQLPYVYVVERSVADGSICGYNDKGQIVARANILEE